MAYAKTIDGYVATRSTQPDDSWVAVTSQPESGEHTQSWVLNGSVITEDETIKADLIDTADKKALKLSGVEFEGVFCSAEAEDMWGLNAIESFVRSGNSTPFKFTNGNVLVLTPENMDAFQTTWVPFRASFFG